MLMVSDHSGSVKPLKKEKTDMAKNILILSASLRASSNSEALANAFADGARAAGHAVEVISLRGKNIAFCRGCLACQTLGRCVIDDDAVAITEKMQHADVIVFATPIYYYEMSGHRIKPHRRYAIMNSTLTLTQEWDKTFPQNDAVDHCKVTFHNRFGIELAADLYKPKNAAGKLAAVAVSGPFGAVKEQSSGLYAQELAARGFLTVAFDPSYTGESGGTPRYVASPDINTEDFSAAVDFLSVRDDVDPERIGILGICGWGGMALNAAAIDTRIKATITSTMYDMTRVTANGYFDADDNPDARYALRQALNAQRTADYKAGTYQRAGGVGDPVPADAPFFVKDYHDYYKTPRGYHPRSLNSTGGWNVTSPLSLLNAKLLAYAGEIRSAVLMIHGDKAHSCYFSRDAFARLQGDNKELLLIPGAVHTDLYDRMDIIPFDRIEAFYHQYLK